MHTLVYHMAELLKRWWSAKGGCVMGGSCCGAIQGWRIDLCLQPLILVLFLPVAGTRVPQGPSRGK